MELWEKSGRTLPLDKLDAIFEEEYTASIADQAEHTPNFDYWFGSGPYTGPVDVERRYNLGKHQLRDLIDYYTHHPDQQPWVTPDGEPAIELGFEETIGGVTVKGFIDLIVETPQGLIVRDIKTGAKPGDTFQLACYSEAMRLRYGVIINRGDYFMGKTGKPTRPITITDDDRAAVHDAFRTLEADIAAGRFDPKPSRDNCAMCAVRSACDYAN